MTATDIHLFEWLVANGSISVPRPLDSIPLNTASEGIRATRINFLEDTTVTITCGDSTRPNLKLKPDLFGLDGLSQTKRNVVESLSVLHLGSDAAAPDRIFTTRQGHKFVVQVGPETSRQGPGVLFRQSKEKLPEWTFSTRPEDGKVRGLSFANMVDVLTL